MYAFTELIFNVGQFINYDSNLARENKKYKEGYSKKVLSRFASFFFELAPTCSLHVYLFCQAR